MASGIGETLRATRRQQGVSLADASADTRVRESYLAALEEEDFSALGGDVYAKGFLRSYARFLGLDPEPLVATYRAEHEAPADDVMSLAQQPVAPMASEGRPGIVVAVGVGALILVVLALIGMFGGGEGDVDLAGAPPPVSESEGRQTSAKTTGPSSEKPAAGASEDAPDQPTKREQRDRREERRARERKERKEREERKERKERKEREERREREEGREVDRSEIVDGDSVEVTLDMADGDSWLKVVVDGETQLEGLQPAGESVTFAGQSVEMVIGDSGVVDVTVNGEELGRLGEPGVALPQTFTAEDSA